MPITTGSFPKALQGGKKKKKPMDPGMLGMMYAKKKKK